MVGRLNDTRLLENLVKSEKDYYAALIDLLALSHSSVASLTGYGSTLHPACSQAVLGVAECLTAADDGLRGYAESIDDWREKLGEIKRLDLDIENAMRDREILVTRLIKVSKQKPKGSQTNLGKSGSKLSQAQAELQACEAHLTAKQRELDDITRSAVKHGLEKRCHALETCGLIWTDKGREGLKVLEALSNESNSPLPSPHPPYSNLSRPYFGRLGNGSTTARSVDSESSLAPSQSASQIATNPNASTRPSEDTHVTSALSNNTIHSLLPPAIPTHVGSSYTNGNYTNTAKKDTPINNVVSLNSRPNSYQLDAIPIHDRAIVAAQEPELKPVAEGDTDDAAAAEEDLGSSDSSSDDEGPVEVHENPVRAAVPMATVVPVAAAAVAAKAREDEGSQLTSKRSLGKPETAVLFPAANGSTRTQPDQKASGGETGPRRSATMDEDRTPKASRVSHLLHRSEAGTGSQRTAAAQPPPPPRSESPSPVRKRAGSGSFFSGIKSFFNPGKGGSVRAASPTKSRRRERDKSPPPPVPKRNDTAGGLGGPWKTRTDKNLKEAKTEMVVGSAWGAISSGAAESSSDEDGTSRKKRKNGGGTFVMRNNNNNAVSNDRDVMGNPVTGPSITGGGGVFDRNNGTLSRMPTKKRLQSADNVAGLGEGAGVQRNVSRRSSDGALPGPSRGNSIVTAKGDANGHRRTKSNVASATGTVTAKETAPAPAPPVPRRSPLRTNSAEIAARRATSGGGKIRKRAPAKQFDDGLGSAGGALIVGPQQPKPATSAMASGNESFGGMGLPASSAVSRATSTVRSTAAGAATGGRGHQRKASDEVEKPTKTPTQTTTTMSNVSPSKGVVGSGAGVSRNNSMASRTSNVSGKSRGSGNNLMSIIEAPSTGIGSKRTSSPVMLEIVRAPGSVTGPQAPILELPSASSLPNLPPYAPARDSSVAAAPSGPPKLLLPSEMRGTQTPASASTTTLRASASEPRREETLAASSSTSRREKHNSVPSALAPPPLRSALRARSPSPQPPSPTNYRPPAGSTTNLLAATAPLSIFAAATRATPETPIENDKDDAASMSSYETGHENLEEPVAHAYEHAAGHGLMGPIVDGPKKADTDLSTSVETDSTTQPRRRKSVRMALPPSATSTPAVTPAALERAEANSYMGYVIGVPAHPTHETTGPANHNEASERRPRVVESPTPRDVWDEEDSDAGGDYGEARKALQRATDDLAMAGRKKRSAA